MRLKHFLKFTLFLSATIPLNLYALNIESEFYNLQSQLRNYVKPTDIKNPEEALDMLRKEYKSAMNGKAFAPETVFRLYEGDSDNKTSDGKTMKCYVLLGVEPKTNKVRMLKNISNIGLGASTNLAKASAVSITNLVRPDSLDKEAVDREMEDVKNRYSYLSYDILPRNKADEDYTEAQLGKVEGLIIPYMKYSTGTKLFSSKKTTSFEYGGKFNKMISKSVSSMEVITDSQDRAVEMTVDVGLFGVGASSTCKKMKEKELKLEALPTKEEVKDLAGLVEDVNKGKLADPLPVELFDGPREEKGPIEQAIIDANSSPASSASEGIKK